jgi:hypothetical protein
MGQLYQDAMAVVRHHGKPDLFITMTCNPSWPEIQNELLPGQIATDRPDLVARVFRMKLSAVLDDIRKKEIFGQVVAHIEVIEFQKRGLPDAHMLFILEHQFSMKTPEDIDTVISAELPDPEEDPILWNTITTIMLHGPCGPRHSVSKAPCFTDGRGMAGSCSKSFPKAYAEETSMAEDGYIRYRRRNNGRMFTKKIRTDDGSFVDFEYTNQWVVPYNPYLSRKYGCHINVEACTSIRAVKYLYKYV